VKKKGTKAKAKTALKKKAMKASKTKASTKASKKAAVTIRRSLRNLEKVPSQQAGDAVMKAL